MLFEFLGQFICKQLIHKDEWASKTTGFHIPICSAASAVLEKQRMAVNISVDGVSVRPSK